MASTAWIAINNVQHTKAALNFLNEETLHFHSGHCFPKFSLFSPFSSGTFLCIILFPLPVDTRSWPTTHSRHAWKTWVALFKRSLVKMAASDLGGFQHPNSQLSSLLPMAQCHLQTGGWPAPAYMDLFWKLAWWDCGMGEKTISISVEHREHYATVLRLFIVTAHSLAYQYIFYCRRM